MHASGGHFVGGHEGHEADQDGGDLPGRIEGFGVEVGDTKAEAGGRLEATGGSVHADGGWGEGVVGREEKGSPVLAVFVRGVGWAGQDVVPFEDVGFGGVGDYVGGWVGLDGLVFAG